MHFAHAITDPLATNLILPNSYQTNVVSPYANNSFPMNANYSYVNNPPFYYSNQFLQLGIQYSDLFGSIVNSKISKQIGNKNALALEFDYGDESNRIAGTWGLMLTPNQFLKFTAERLSQLLPFDFVTGNVEQRIPQYAYGSAYEFVFPNSKLNDINIEGYYAQAQSHFLNSIFFISDGSEFIDLRHIAGATSSGGSLGIDTIPWNTAALGVKLNYDAVHYNAVYVLQGTNQNDNEFGVTLNFEQLLSQHLKLNLSGSKRAPYDEYGGGLSWLFTTSPVEVGFSVDHIISHNSTPDETEYLVRATIGFSRDSSQGLQRFYAPSFATKDNLMTWTDAPAVHMDRVLATADEIIKKVALILSSLSPISGPTTGGTLITITGNGFTPSTAINFESVASGLTALSGLGATATATATAATATNVIFVNNQTLQVTTPAHSAGLVTVTATNPDGSSSSLPNAFTFVAAGPALESITVTPANPSVAAGLQQQFTATGHFSDGSTQNITSQVTWTSLNSGTATINASGLATGVAVGSTTITATKNSVSGNTVLSVTAAVLQSIVVTPVSVSVVAGFTQQYTAMGHYSNGTTQNITSTVTWASSNQSAATISNLVGTQGLATGVAAGATTISATLNSIVGNTSLTITPPVLQSITVSPANATITTGGTLQYTATGNYSNGTTQDLTTSATWNSSNSSAATISNLPGTQGLATGTATGTELSTTISATFNSITGSTSLTVTPESLEFIVITPPSASVAAGLTQQFTATGHYTDGSTHDLTTQATWHSSSTSVATVDATGLAKGVAVGTSNISATFDLVVSDNAVLTVTPAVLQSITVMPPSASVAAGLTQQFTATGNYSDGSTQPLTTSVTWNSSNPSAATISNLAGSQGLAKGVAVGTANISATLGSITSSNAVLTVTPAVLQTIIVTPSSASVAAGLTQQFTATGNYSDGSTQDLTTSATWNSSNPSAATISNVAGSQGLATGVAVGTTNISAMFNAVTSNNAVLTVTPPVLQSITVTPANQTIISGNTLQYTATGHFSDGSTSDITTAVTWASTNTSAATISNVAGTQGLATGVATGTTGTTTITATQNAISGSTNLTVIVLQSITVTPANATIAVGATQQYTATGHYSDSSTQNLTAQVVWGSSNSAAATISAGGLATGVAVGSTSISATKGTVVGSTGLSVAAVPHPTGVNPASGPSGGGQGVTIQGSGFTGTTGVTFGGNAATNVVVINDGVITCRTPGNVAGPADITVTNLVGSGTLSHAYTYI